MKLVTLKLVFRSWWRNKTFSIISIVSLAVGIACTNLLAAFVIYEFNIETDNPNREELVYMTQDSPMASGQEVSYIAGNIPVQLKEQYTEVEDYLRFNSLSCTSVQVDEQLYAPIRIATVDTSFPRFFSYKVLYGDLREALAQPGKAAISNRCARRLFGETNAVGRTLVVNRQDAAIQVEGEETAPTSTFRIAAVVEAYPQSFLSFDLLTGLQADFYGGPVLLKVSPAFRKESFPAKLQKDQVPTLQMEQGSYHFYSLQDAYFQEFSQERIPYINRGQRTLLYVGQVSALLILLIACFNYINLSFSRVLQQVRTLHVQKLMGASPREINRQLFADTFLTVLIAFGLSLLIAHDLLPLFNRIMSGRLSAGFFLGKQVVPFICLLIGLLSFIPAFYMSRKMAAMTDCGYRRFFTGTKKRRIVTALSVVQYMISIGLVIATLTVHAQLKLVQKGGERFRNLIEIGHWGGDVSYILPLAQELNRYPGVAGLTLAGSSIQSAALRQIVIRQPDGSEQYASCIQYLGEGNLLDLLQLSVLQGLPPETALRQYEQPVYISRKYADILVPPGENPVGQPISRYDTYLKKEGASSPIICGITENLYLDSMEEEPYPAILYLSDRRKEQRPFLYIRLHPEQKQAALATIKRAWEKVNPGVYFSYQDVYAGFMQRNRKTTDMANLLLMYALISIFLTCFGLFGMARYATQQCTKEIGIRKVNGAGTGSIWLLLTGRFVKEIGVAFVVATPVTWLLLDRWLEGFANRVSVSPVYFLAGGGIVCGITLLTVGWHSYRAALGNPVDSLKSE